jgi:hypothetical protein
VRKLPVLLLLTIPVAALAHVALAQEDGTSGSNRDGGASEVLQSIYIPPMHNAPFTATVHTEWARPMAGGGTNTIVNQRKVARDRDGRLYEERWLLIPKNNPHYRSVMNLVQIYDPNEHTGYDCFLIGPQKDHCELRNYAGIVRTDVPAKTGPLPNHIGFRTHEDLGTRMIEGIETTGIRDTSTIAAGVGGNDQPMKIVREYWHSAQLGINLLSILSDPRIGTQTFTLTDVAVTETDPKLFEIPEGFQIVDTRQPEDLQKPAAPSN